MTELNLREDTLGQALSAVAKEFHQNAKNKGFWDRMLHRPTSLTAQEDKAIDNAYISQMLMLAVSELGEAMEALRHGNPPDDKLPQHGAFEVEIADAIIRLLDTAYGLGHTNIGQIVMEKHVYNTGRKPMHGSKEF